MTTPDVALALPEVWQTVPLELLGDAPGLVLVAAHRTPDAGFTANITVGAQQAVGDGDMVALGDEAVRRVAATEQEVTVRRRDLIGADPVTGLVQEVALTTAVEGGTLDLVQAQAFVLAADPEDAGRTLLWTVTGTATEAQVADVAEAVAGVVATLVG